MAKGDDAVRKKKNKKSRKKLQKESSSSSKVSNRVASIIAAKKRRLSSKRRMCQGMCFSLPTPENPFNDRHRKVDLREKKIKKLVPSKLDHRVGTNKKSVAIKKGTLDRNQMDVDHQEQQTVKVDKLENEQTLLLRSIKKVRQKCGVKLGKSEIHLIDDSGATHPPQGHTEEYTGCPSKFLFLCLNSIENALRHDGAFSCEEDKPFFADPWGAEFWKCYSIGKDIIETSGAASTTEQIAWMASTAADAIARKEKEGQSFTSPFLLFLVPSQDKAAKVRSVCKPLKALGIHTVSLHPGASLDHQIHGLKSCEPEFLVSTPERLLELVSLKAVDISGVSLLVVDGLETLLKGSYPDPVKFIRQSIDGTPHTVIFNDCLSYTSIPVLYNLLQRSVCRLSLNDAITSQSACIIQSIHVCPSEEERLSQGIQVLDQASCTKRDLQHFKVLYIVGKDSQFHDLVTAIKSKGYMVSTNSDCINSGTESSKMGPAVFVNDTEHINTADLSGFEVVIILNMGFTSEKYVQILTRMARFTVNGMLHSFLTNKDAPMAGPLIKILEQCGQAVPESLRQLLHVSSSMLGTLK